ncbi:hypothetical protein NL676_021957 [Syzygium grande]|nr:hypothetical protein NL676_021957 [Syzygium grande]
MPLSDVYSCLRYNAMALVSLENGILMLSLTFIDLEKGNQIRNLRQTTLQQTCPRTSAYLRNHLRARLGILRSKENGATQFTIQNLIRSESRSRVCFSASISDEFESIACPVAVQGGGGGDGPKPADARELESRLSRPGRDLRSRDEPDLTRHPFATSEALADIMWLLTFGSLVFLWFASLIAYFPRKPAFLISGENANKSNVLLVIAHPDDESMFFSPTISYLTSRGHNLHILCLSVGDADGKGNIRKEELYQACVTLEVPCPQVKVMDHPDLQDGFGNKWNHDLLSKIIEQEVLARGIHVVITFDDYGVSGHCNHRDVHYGVRKLLQVMAQRDIEAWELVSTNILRKYSGPVDFWISTLFNSRCPTGSVHCLMNENPRRSFIAMSQHSSQWVWFRKLFVSFSSYTYVNTLRSIDGSEPMGND